MAITPADIDQLTFSPSKQGYDTEEVDAFLERLSGELDAMLQKIADLKGRLNNSEQQLAAANEQVAQLSSQLQAGDATQAAVSAPLVSATDTSASEAQISRVLIVAQQSADKIISDAKDSADKIRTEADQRAREVIRAALAEKQNELDEIDRLKASREEFRSEYKNLLQHFMDDADAAFPNQMLSSASTATDYHAAAPSVTAAAAKENPSPVAPEHTPAISLDDLD